MKLFCLIWLMLFFGALGPVIKLDMKLARRKYWARFNDAINGLNYCFINLSMVSNAAAESINKFSQVFQIKEVKK